MPILSLITDRFVCGNCKRFVSLDVPGKKFFKFFPVTLNLINLTKTTNSALNNLSY